MSSNDPNGARHAGQPPTSTYPSPFRLLSQAPRSHWAGPGAPSPGREIWRYFAEFGNRCCRCSGCQAPNCWGSTILRVSYEDDARFALAVAAIRRLAVIAVEYDHQIYTDPQTQLGWQPVREAEKSRGEMHTNETQRDEIMEKAWLAFVQDRAANSSGDLTTDRLVTDELKNAFHCNIVEDRAALEGMGPGEAQRYFCDSKTRPEEDGLRSSFFMYLDQETIEQLAGAPSDEELAQMSIKEQCRVAWQHWVKIIAATDEEDYEVDEGEDGEYAQQLRVEDRKRVRLLDLLGIYDQLSGVAGVLELLVEGSDRTRDAQDQKREWCFVGNFDGVADQDEWLGELYGDRGRPGQWQ